MQDYKSVCAAVTICAIPVNIQTHTDRQIALWPAHTNLASWEQWKQN